MSFRSFSITSALSRTSVPGTASRSRSASGLVPGSGGPGREGRRAGGGGGGAGAVGGGRGRRRVDHDLGVGGGFAALDEPPGSAARGGLVADQEEAVLSAVALEDDELRDNPDDA